LLFFLVLFLSCKNQIKKRKEVGNLFYDKAFEYRENHKPDSAFLYFNKAKDLFLQQKDSFGVGKCLVNMAIISTDKGDYYGGQEISLNAISYLNNNKEEHLVYIKSNFNNLGITSFNLRNYSQAIDFYKRSLNYTKDSTALFVIRNNIANAYSRKRDYQKSLAIYQSILRQIINNQEFARSLSNFAFTKWLQNSLYNAKPELLRALHIHEKANDLWGQNASYAHLADYYAQKQPDSALIYAGKMYQVAKEIKSPDDQIEALQKLVELSPPKETKHHFEIYKRLDDSLQTARTSAKNQFALIRYEAEKNKAENLNLQKDNTEKKYQIIKQRILLFSTFLLILAGFIISVLWYKKRKQRLELEAKNTIRDNQLKTYKKVHDVVANGLYRLMKEIQNRANLEREDIVNKLDVMYEKSRDISYEKPQTADENFHEKIVDLLTSFATADIRVGHMGSTPDLWEQVNAQTKYEIEHILQELMVNMERHSKGSNVFVKFEQEDNHISLHYADDGIGISKGTQFNNGLTSTGNRIKSIHGTITFDTKSEKGLKIYISFPVR
jgi:tetratricopeptide (TPR) repeat protein